MLTGEPLFTLTDDSKAKSQIVNRSFLLRKLRDTKHTISVDAMDLLEKMLKPDPKHRIAAKDALGHPFVMRTYMEHG